MIEKNPWIMGTFSEDTATGKLYIKYTLPPGDDSNNIDKQEECCPKKRGMLTMVAQEDSKLLYGMSCDDTAKLSVDWKLKDGNDRNQPFLKITLVPCCVTTTADNGMAPTTARFCLFFSMSHVLGDGHTYYRLYNMLMNYMDSPVEPLTVDRIPGSMEQRAKLLGEKESKIFFSLGFGGVFMRGKLKDWLSSWWNKWTNNPSPPSYRICLVDQQKIATIKKEYNESNKNNEKPPFISTNDIITSWLFSNKRIGRKHGVMVVNWRDRIDGHTRSHVGNYFDILTYAAADGDASSPEQIRTSLKDFKRASYYDGQEISLPKMALNHLCILSNWSSFGSSSTADDTNLTGCRILCHMPTTDLDWFPSTVSCCCVFLARPGKLGIMVPGTVPKMPFESDEEDIWEN